IVRKSGGNAPVEYFRIKMENIMITSYTTGGSKDGLDRIQETLTLNFRKFEVLYTLQEDSGAAGAETMAGWDIAENREWNS
ncbi:MAG: type VI secretion system tube protein Hcp, partial [Paracoccus sp. (in: a-proteobacteria)]|nr:type VI secretion system tube protein Hcp [Paracoccus sp. (in: a-proteobacteria)]